MLRADEQNNTTANGAGISFLQAFIALWACAIVTGVNLQNPLWIGAFAALLLLFRRVPLQPKKPVTVLSLLYALLTVMARFAFYTAQFTSGLFKAGYTIIALTGLFLFYRALCDMLVSALLRHVSLKVLIRPGEGWVTHLPLLTVPACLLCWLPYYLYEYPGIVSPDGINQLEQILGIEPLSNHHPVAHTLTMGLFWRIGSLFSDNPNTCLAVVTAAQMLFLAICAAVAVGTLRDLGFRPAVQGIVLAFYALVPYNAVCAVLVLKDAPFSGITVLFVCLLIKLLFSGEDKPRLLPLIGFVLTGIAFCIYRSNGWFAFLVVTPLLLILCFRKRRLFVHLLAGCAAVILVSALWRGPALDAMGAVRPDFAESLHVPLQQVSRVLVDGEEISADDCAMIEAVIDTTWISELYAPTFADNIKELVRAGHPEVLEENKGAYLLLWLRLGIQHPGAYLRATIDLTDGMWFPDAGVDGIADIDGIYPNDLGLESTPLLSGPVVVKIKELLLKLGPLLPLYSYLWSMGFWFWLLLFVAAVLFSAGQKSLRERLCLLLPCAAIYLTLFLATPGGRIFRYVYPMVLSAPLLFLAPFIPEEE